MQIPTRTILAPALALTLSSGLALAQVDDTLSSAPATSGLIGSSSARPAPSVFGQSHGTAVETNGTLAGFGRGYRASFEAGQVEFLPALGAEANRTFPLTFSLEQVGRRSHLQDAKARAPREDGGLVTYDHGSFVEHYEVRAEGVYQSFVFDTRPLGSGELVVRGHLATDLMPQRQDDGSLLFHRGDGAGLSIGTVTGIDADGRTAAGELRLDGNVLELALPESFVDSASYPLTLDPLIGSITDVDDTAASDLAPQIASSGFALNLVVWQRSFSFSHSEVYGQLVDSDGELVGSLLAISTGSGTISAEPSAGYVDAEDNFLVAYSYSPNVFAARNIRAVSVRASFISSSVSPSASVAASGNQQLRPDVGGDWTGTDNEAFVVWQESGVGIRGRQVTPLDSGPVGVGNTPTIAADSATTTILTPKISQAIDDGTDFLITWVQDVNNSTRSFVWGRMYDRNANPQTSATALHTNAFLGHEAIDCDGDGSTFLAVWQRTEGVATADWDIVCRPIEWDGSSMQLGAVRAIEENANDNETAPTVAMGRYGMAVAFLDEDGTTNAYLKAVDPYTGLWAGEVQLPETGTATRPSIGRRRNVTSDRVMVAWEDSDDIVAQIYDLPGTNSTLGGGCGLEGTLSVPCALAGNDDFTIHLRDATPGVLAALVIGSFEELVACGPCTLFPNLESVYYDTTDADGHASVNIPIAANLGGVTFYAQWATFVPIGACPLAPLDFSDCVRTTIESTP